MLYPTSTEICAAALSTKPDVKCQYTALLPVKEFPKEDVEYGFTMAYTMWGKAFKRGDWDSPAQPEHYEFGNMFFRMAEKLIAEGKVVPHPATVRPGGLNGVLEG